MPLRRPTIPAEALPDNLATEVDAFLRENLARPIRLADLARHFGVCERTLTQQYRHLTGDTIIARLRRIRLEAAQALLQSSAYSLAEIGQRVGLPDPAYLCRCYTRQFGQPPGHHRRSFRRGG